MSEPIDSNDHPASFCEEEADGARLSLEQAIVRYGFIVVSGKGTSMLPLIQNSRDRMYIEPAPTPLSRFDVAVYRGSGGNIIAHRILGIPENGKLSVCGDNQLVPEIIQADAVIGRVRGIFRGKRFIDFTASRACRAYVRFWCSSFFIRRICLSLLHRLSPRYRKECAMTRKTAE